MQDQHKRAAKLLGYALTLGNGATWEAASAVWAARLSKVERAGILFAALRALEPAEALEVVEVVLGGDGPPLPPLIDPVSDAQLWADTAGPAELRAYALAAFLRLPRHEQRDFLAFAKGAL